MAPGDDMMVPSVSSSGLDSVELGQGRTMLLTEDVAWADSCLTKDPETIENGWNSLRYALLETLCSQPDSLSHETETLPQSDEMEIFSSTEGTGDGQNHEKATTATASNGETSQPSSIGSPNRESADELWPGHNLENVFLATYNENLRGLGTSDPEVDMVLQTLKLDQSTDDIFKVWDLDIPPEEDDLVKQLHEAFTESSLEPNAAVSDEFKWKGLNDLLLDDLISGINDLSLSPNSNRRL